MKKTIKNVLLTTAGAASVLAGVQLSANASTVKSIKGDTVWAFAQKNHTTVDAIVKANHLTNANLIYVDQELTIPDAKDTANQTSQASQSATSDASATSQAASANSADANGNYTVVAGDTLNAIASRTGKSVSDLASLNGISNINVLMVGQVLHTTGTASQATSVASQASQASQAPASQASQASQTSQAPASVASQASQTSQASQAASTTSQASQAPASVAASQAPVSQASQAPASAATKQTTSTSTAYAGGAAAGIAGFYSGVDGYPAGQCTAFVAGILQAEGIPSSQWAYLGNGNAWGANAAARGVAVNQTPTAGSVAFFGYMHVAYVTSVNGNGTVNIIEGNFNGQSYNARTISASEAAGYIHF